MLAATIVLATAFAGTAAWQLWADPYALPADGPLATTPPNGPQSLPRPQAPDMTERWVEVALARPLFRLDRRPVAPAEASRRPTEEVPRLTALLSGPFGRRAIFAGANGRSSVVTVGSAVNGWTVKAIEAGAVSLAGRDGERIVRLANGAPKPAPEPQREPIDEHAGGELLRRPVAGPVWPPQRPVLSGRR